MNAAPVRACARAAEPSTRPCRPCLTIVQSVRCVGSQVGGTCARSGTSRALRSGTGALPGGRVASWSKPSTPCSGKRACRRQKAGFATPTRRLISVVPQPSACAGTMRARQTCFRFELPSSTTVSKRQGSSSRILISAPSAVAGRPIHHAGTAFAAFKPLLQPLEANGNPSFPAIHKASLRASEHSPCRVARFAVESAFDFLEREPANVRTVSAGQYLRRSHPPDRIGDGETERWVRPAAGNVRLRIPGEPPASAAEQGGMENC